MYKYITRFFFWLFPIVKQALVQVLAEEIHKFAYPDRPYRRLEPTPYTRYARPPRTRREAVRNVGRAVREADALTHEGRQFHDVLLVAFDISGPSARETHQWLMDNMPSTGLGGDTDEIYLDAWWVANDERFDRSDTDSAVFVHKGYQGQARNLLRENEIGN